MADFITFDYSPTVNNLPQSQVAYNPFDPFSPGNKDSPAQFPRQDQPVVFDQCQHQQQAWNSNMEDPFFVAQQTKVPNSLVTNTTVLVHGGQRLNSEITVFGTFDTPRHLQSTPTQGAFQRNRGSAANNHGISDPTGSQAPSWSAYNPSNDNSEPVWEEHERNYQRPSFINDNKRYADYQRERGAEVRALRLLEKTMTPGTKISSKAARLAAVEKYHAKKQQEKKQEIEQPRKFAMQQRAAAPRLKVASMAESSRQAKTPTTCDDSDLVVEKCQLDVDRQKWAQSQALKMMSSYF